MWNQDFRLPAQDGSHEPVKCAPWVLTFAAACVLSPQARAAPRPNILYFYVDDMGWGSIGPNGQTARKAAGKPFVRTPHLDKLAAKLICGDETGSAIVFQNAGVVCLMRDDSSYWSLYWMITPKMLK